MLPGKRVTKKLRSIRAAALRAAFGLALLLLAGQAMALGLGRIEVKSRAGQPLLAEIQVVSSDPAELDALQARLASPDTFRRIGLDPPDGVVSGLQFSVALDARGNPVIRVTTREPVTQPTLTFLVEVDWGQGRLVREYSALVDAPQTVSAPAQPAIEAPVAAPSNTIVRAPEPAPAAEPVETAVTGTDADTAVAADTREADAGAEVTAEEAPRPAAPPAPAPPAAAAPPAQPLARADEYGPVKAGETLGRIAGRLAGDGVTREQAIVALFRANPGAFIAGNLNLVREGAVLRIPDRDAMAGLDLRESRALMREQVAAWREMTRPAPQPDAAVAPAGEGGDAPAQAQAGDAAAAAPRAAEARLEIVPPSAQGARQAGIRSGIQAGGEGEMLRQELQQELQQSQEAVAAREAEVAELKARVADLERLQAQQAQLISMKDSELAAVQERLATTAGPAPAEPAAAEPAAAGLPWAWIGLGLLVVALVAWLLARRAPKPASRPRFDPATLAAAAPAAPAAAPAAPAGTNGRPERAGEASPAAVPAVPAWHAGGAAVPSAAPATVPSAGPAPGPTRQARPAPAFAAAEPAVAEEGQAPVAATQAADAADAALVASLNPAPGGADRIELARAYLDLGDVDTARGLLLEVAEAGEPGARAEASRLLDGIA